MGKSIYQQICDNITDGILNGSFSLPDEEKGFSPLRFAPGAFDGMCMYHMRNGGLDAAGSKEMAKALKTAAAGNYKEANILFHEWTKEHRAVSYIDELQKYVIDHASKLNAGNLYNTALSMVLHSEYIECVKIGMELMELFSNPNENLKEIIRRIGLYDEFTIFSVWNMQKWDDGNEEIFALAKKCHSWGRIHAVERLEPETEEIRRWLLTEGTINEVVNAYSSLTCWQKSGAETVLFGYPSQEEYKALLTLLEGMLDEGPVPGISALETSEPVLLRFMELAPEYDLSGDDYDIFLSAKHWADDEDAPHPAVSSACSALLRSPKCIEAIETAVKEGQALRLAEELRLPFRDQLLQCMQNDFDHHYYDCRHLMNDPDYVEPTIALFQEMLSLSEMKGDPIDDPCFGKEYEQYDKLQCILQELDETPLNGLNIVKAGLESPVSRNRYRALFVLERWVQKKGVPLSELLPDVYKMIQHLQHKEIDDKCTQMIVPLLEGETVFIDEDDEFDESEDE